MIEFREFGLASVVVDKLFACLRDADGNVVRLFSDRGAPVQLEGEDARLFLAFLRKHTAPPETSEAARPVLQGPQTAPRPVDPLRKSAPSGG